MGQSVDTRTYIGDRWKGGLLPKPPVVYVSGLFWGSQLNWATMTKEAYAKYMTIKKSTFYITGHDVTLRSDYLPLNNFLKQMTLNKTVNKLGNGSIEL